MVDERVVPIVGIVGAGSGMTLGVFIGEVITRATGQTGWAKFGIKAIVKGLLTGLIYLISGRLGGLASFGFEVASYGIAGSIIPDVFEAAIPGGILGLAEGLAVAVRVTAVGKEGVKGEIESLDKGLEKGVSAEAATPWI